MNAGLGSNLNINGFVECDATIVDHYGRSGAVGATQQIRNPIHLARLVLENSETSNPLNQVPPTLLVGTGTSQFATRNSVLLVPKEAMISQSAKDYWLEMISKLQGPDSTGFNDQQQQQRSESSVNSDRDIKGTEPAPAIESDFDAISDIGKEAGSEFYNSRREEYLSVSSTNPHAKDYNPAPAIEPDFGTTRNNGAETGSEFHNSRGEEYLSDSSTKPHAKDYNSEPAIEPDLDAIRNNGEETRIEFHNSRGEEYLSDSSTKFHAKDDNPAPAIEPDFDTIRNNGKETESEFQNSRGKVNLSDSSTKSHANLITDTVGAIAIDCFGNIGAGSSSGGAALKQQGRIGPAALVGIGTAVIPINPKDPQKICSATVASGTGDHMSTTMAANSCAWRVHYSMTDSTTNVISDYIEEEFMAHPSVRYSPVGGAIGLLGVKKTVDGLCCYFAHNTQSFVYAHMSTGDVKPKSVVSTCTKGRNVICSGSQTIRYLPKNENEKTGRSGDRDLDNLDHLDLDPVDVTTWPSNPDKDHNPPEWI